MPRVASSYLGSSSREKARASSPRGPHGSLACTITVEYWRLGFRGFNLFQRMLMYALPTTAISREERTPKLRLQDGDCALVCRINVDHGLNYNQ